MRIISNNTCSECSYFIEECDNCGLCCKNDEYTSVKPEQPACLDFCGDNSEFDTIEEYINNMEDDNNLYDDY